MMQIYHSYDTCHNFMKNTAPGRYLRGIRQPWHSTVSVFSAPLISRLTAIGDGPRRLCEILRVGYCSRNARAARQTPNKLIYFCELVK